VKESSSITRRRRRRKRLAAMLRGVIKIVTEIALVTNLAWNIHCVRKCVPVKTFLVLLG